MSAEYSNVVVTRGPDPAVSTLDYTVTIGAEGQQPIVAYESLRMERVDGAVKIIGRGDMVAIPVELIGVVFEEFAFLAPEGLASA